MSIPPDPDTAQKNAATRRLLAERARQWDYALARLKALVEKVKRFAATGKPRPP